MKKSILHEYPGVLLVLIVFACLAIIAIRQNFGPTEYVISEGHPVMIGCTLVAYERGRGDNHPDRWTWRCPLWE